MTQITRKCNKKECNTRRICARTAWNYTSSPLSLSLSLFNSTCSAIFHSPWQLQLEPALQMRLHDDYSHSAGRNNLLIICCSLPSYLPLSLARQCRVRNDKVNEMQQTAECVQSVQQWAKASRAFGSPFFIVFKPPSVQLFLPHGVKCIATRTIKKKRIERKKCETIKREQCNAYAACAAQVSLKWRLLQGLRFSALFKCNRRNN